MTFQQWAKAKSLTSKLPCYYAMEDAYNAALRIAADLAESEGDTWQSSPCIGVAEHLRRCANGTAVQL